MNKIPLMIYGDSVTGTSGLGRLARDLATRIHANMSAEVELASFGYGGGVSRHIPWVNYAMSVRNYIPVNLEHCWRDFAGDRRGVLLVCHNASWVNYIANPSVCPDDELKKFLLRKPFSRWLYAPIDGDSIDGKLPQNLGDCMRSFDRILAYTKYGASVLDRTFGLPLGTTEHLPHGTDTSIFYPRDRKIARDSFVQRVAQLKPSPLVDGLFLIGIIATNSERKDHFLGLEVCAELVKRGVNLGLWLHTDNLKKHWNLIQLVEEFGLTDRTIASNRTLSDDELAWGYSACDVTLGIGNEGWGMPLSESLACNCPVVSGNYAGQTDFVPRQWLVDPIGFYGRGFFGIRAACYRASDWADTIMQVKREDAVLPTYLQWDVAWDGWQKWLRAGLADLNKNPADQPAATFGSKQ